MGRLKSILVDKKSKIIITVIVLALIAVLATVSSIFGVGERDDIRFHLWRIEAIKYGLQNGIFPVRMYGLLLDNAGYASGIYYPDLFLYIPAVFRILGLNIEWHRSYLRIIELLYYSHLFGQHAIIVWKMSIIEMRWERR